MLIPVDGGIEILGENPDGPGWVVRVVTFARDETGSLVLDALNSRLVRCPPFLHVVTELPPQPWLSWLFWPDPPPQVITTGPTPVNPAAPTAAELDGIAPRHPIGTSDGLTP